MISSVVSNISGLISQASPVIAGLVSAIGVAVVALAPVFSTIFDGIGEKVSSVIGFIGERMGFIQEVIAVAGPAIGSVLTTAWSVISPIMDLCISVFELVFQRGSARVPRNSEYPGERLERGSAYCGRNRFSYRQGGGLDQQHRSQDCRLWRQWIRKRWKECGWRQQLAWWTYLGR